MQDHSEEGSGSSPVKVTDLRNRGLTDLQGNLQAISIDTEKLLLSNNRIETLQDIETACPDLAYLVADNNRIGSLAQVQSLVRLYKLVSVSFVGNPISELHGYRSLVITLLPDIQVLDGIPVTKEDQSSAAAHCRQNLGNLKGLIKNKTHLTYFKSIIEDIREHMARGGASIEALRSLKVTNFKNLLDKAIERIDSELGNLEQEWSIGIIEDLELLANDMKQNGEKVDKVMDRAFLELWKLQLAKLEELKTKVHALISEYNALVESVAKEKNLSREKVAKRNIIQEKSEQKSTPQRQYTPNSDIKPGFFPTEKKSTTSLNSKAAFQTPYDNPASKQSPSPSPARSIRERVTAVPEHHQKLDTLTRDCQTRDAEISSLMAQNLDSEGSLRKLDQDLAELREKQHEMRKLEEIKSKLIQEVARLEPCKVQADELNSRAGKLEAHIASLSHEISYLQSEIKSCLELEANQEMADDLRNFHLKARLFQSVRSLLHVKRQESVADQFRQYKLQTNLVKSWIKTTSLERRFKIYGERLDIQMSKDCNDELKEKTIAEKFQEKRATKWRAFYLSILEENVAERQKEESLKKMAQKFNGQKLKGKAIKSFKGLMNLYYGDPKTDEKIYQVAVVPKIEQKKLSQAWLAWKTIFQSDLRPLYLKRKIIEKNVSSIRKSAILNAWQNSVSENKAKIVKLAAIQEELSLKQKFKYWVKLTRKLQHKQTWISRKLAGLRLKHVFGALCQGVSESIHQRVCAEEEAKLQPEEKECLRQALESEPSDRSRVKDEAVEEFRKKWVKKNLFESIKSATFESKSAKGAFERLEEIKVKHSLRESLDNLTSTKKEADIRKHIDDSLPGLKSSFKSHKKQLVLELWREAARMLAHQKFKVDVIQGNTRLNLMRKALRGLKKNKLAMLTDSMRKAEKLMMILQERSRKDALNKVKIANENSFLVNEISVMEQNAAGKHVAIEESRRSNKRIQASKASMAIKIELAKKETKDIQAKFEKSKDDLENDLEERKLKSAILRQQLQDALEEIRGLDRKLEGMSGIT